MNSVVKNISGNVITVDFPGRSNSLQQHERLIQRFNSVEKEFAALVNQDWRRYEVDILRHLRIDPKSVVKPKNTYSLMAGTSRKLNGDFLCDMAWLSGSSVIDQNRFLGINGFPYEEFTAENLPFRSQDEVVHFLCIPNFSRFNDVVSRLEHLRSEIESLERASTVALTRWSQVGLLTNELSEEQIQQLEDMYFVPVTDLDIELFMEDRKAGNG